MRVRRAIVVALVLVAGIASFAGSAAAKPLTKAQFVAHANALCNAAAKAIAPVFQQLGSGSGPPTAQQVTAFIGGFAPIVQNQINKTKALKPPTRDQTKVTKMLQADQAELNMVKGNPQLLGGKQSPFLGADSMARKYGLEDAPGAGVCVRAAG